MSDPIIFGPYGQPVSSKFLRASENSGRHAPPEFIRALTPLKKLITRPDWLAVSFMGDKIDANFGISEGIISQKAMFAVTNGWSPIFMGEDQVWGDAVTDWLVNVWFPTCDVRGPNYDFVTGLYMDSVSVDARGDAITMLTKSEDGDGDWPMLQRIPNRQIGQWSNEEKVIGGDYDGANIENGVISNSNGRPIAYRKLGLNRGDFEDIPANDIVHTFEPRWLDQARGFPIFSACIDLFRAMLSGHDMEMQTMNIASAIGLIEYNETGDSTDGFSMDDPLNNQPESTAGPDFKSMMGGMVRYFKANGGGKLEQLVNQRPGEDWETFNDRLIRVCCCAANWPYSLAWKKDGTNGTATRADQNMARKAISDRQDLLKYPAVRAIRYAVSVAINNKLIPPYKGSDLGGFLKWSFSMPPIMTIDEGRDRDNDREDYKIGFGTLEEKALKCGTTSKKIRDTREREVNDLLTRAARITAKHKDVVPFDTVMTLLEQRTTNANAPGGRFGSAFEEEEPAPTNSDL
jgi:hypothetical protein